MNTPASTAPASTTASGLDRAMPALVGADATRPSPASAGPATLAFTWRTLLRIRHVPEQLFDVLAIPVVFTLLFTYLFGGALAGSPRDYLQFLLPGTFVMTVVLLTTFTGLGLRSDLSTGVFERFRSLPVWRPAPLVGALLGDLCRYLVAMALVLGLGLAMGFRPDAGLTGTLAAVGLVLAFALALSWVWIVIGLTARTPAAVNAISLAVLFPLTLASNTFVDPATMPGWLRAVVDHNPISFVVAASRGLMHGEGAGGDVLWVLATTAALLLVAVPVALRRYRTHP